MSENKKGLPKQSRTQEDYTTKICPVMSGIYGAAYDRGDGRD